MKKQNLPTSKHELSTVPTGRGWRELFLAVFLALHLVWIHTMTVFGRVYVDFVFGTTYGRQIVVIGDDQAYGVGDWVTMFGYPGLHRRINEYIAQQQKKNALFRGTLWTAYCYATPGSTTADWLPNRMRDPKADRATCYFDQCFDKYIGKYNRGADIVCVMLGCRDRCEPEETVENLRCIIVELVKRGKYVLIGTLPMAPRIVKIHEANRRFVARNQQIEAMVAEVHAELSTVAGYTGVFAIPLGRMAFEERMFRFGERFLSGPGYTRCASLFIDQLLPVMRSVEFRATIPKAYPMGSPFT